MPQSHYHWNDREHDVTIGFELCMNIKNLVGYVANFLAARWVRSCAWYPSRTAQFVIFCYGWSERCTAHSRCRRCGDGNMTRRGQPLGCTYLAHFFCILFHPLGMLICALFVSPSLRPKTLSSRMQDQIGSRQKKINHYLGPWVPPCSAIVFKWKCGHRQTWTSYHNGTVHNWWSLCCHAILFFVRQLVLICLVCDNHSKRTTLKSNFWNEWFRHRPCLCPPTTSTYLQNCGFDVAAGC